MKSKQIYNTRVVVKTIEGMDKYNPRFSQIFDCPHSTYAFETHPLGDGKNLRVLRFKDDKRTHDFIIDEFKGNELVFENNQSQACILQFESKDALVQFFMDVSNKQPIFADYERQDDKYEGIGQPLKNDALKEKLELLINETNS